MHRTATRYCNTARPRPLQAHLGVDVALDVRVRGQDEQHG